MMFRSAIESIDAGVSLLALGQPSQAFMLLVQAAEVSLKGILDEINLSGTRKWTADNPVLVRTLAKSGQSVDHSLLRKIVTEKTFIATFREVHARISFSDQVVSGYEAVNATRNRIAHQGGECEHANLYLGQILDCILPILDEFYTKLLGMPISSFICHHVARELIVANRYLRSHGQDIEAWAVALRPMAAAYFSRRIIEHGAPLDFDPHGFGWDERFDMNFEWEKKVAGSLKGNVLEAELTYCKICGERCYLATDGVLKWHQEIPYFDVSSMACAHCHLTVSDEHSDLARLHYGMIDEKLLGHEVWVKMIRDFGLDPDNLQDS
jgi:hypothetical protein